MNKNILENLIANSFDLETREGFGTNEGKIIPLNFNLSCDLAYIRMILKRKLVKGNYEYILLRDNKLNNTRLYLKSFEGLNSLQLAAQCTDALDRIVNWCNVTIQEGYYPGKITLE